MRTRGTAKESTPPPASSSSSAANASVAHGAERPNIADMSRNAVDKVIRRTMGRCRKEQDNGSRSKEKRSIDTKVTWNEVDAQRSEKVQKEREQKEVGASSFPLQEVDNEMDGIDWEDGSTSVMDPVKIHSNPGDDTRTLTIDFGTLPDSAKRKPSRRATAADKELAELVHRAHLLCILARGRLVDTACDDLLIQAALLSLVPTNLLYITNVSKLTAKALSPIVRWFHINFRVKSAASEKRSCSSALACALENREGSAEEIAALSVALFRALKLTTRFVSILDATSLKPEVDDCESSSHSRSRVRRGIFTTSTPMVDGLREVSMFPNCPESSSSALSKSTDANTKRKKHSSHAADEFNAGTRDSLPEEAQTLGSIIENSQGSKRKSDIEFEMQLQMALSTTAVADSYRSATLDVMSPNSSCSEVLPSPKRIRRVAADGFTPISSAIGSQKIGSPLYWAELSNSRCSEVLPSFERIRRVAAAGFTPISTAIGSQKVGSPLYWAEIYCTGENLAGKWVHVDAINAIVDGEHQVEAAAAACKTSLRYAVAFAGRGAKDVTRRYCMKWHKIASQRVNSVWWDAVLAPLRELESAATGGQVQLADNGDIGSSLFASRNSVEDMELETRALTEPLPTNQQAYRSHHLYAIEKWLTKFQILHPKGPVLGFCSGNPVYPRACVQTLKTKERWLREALQVKANELPAKVLKESKRRNKVQLLEGDECDECDSNGNIELYGKWQLEPLLLPPAVNGIVPKNERGQVDVWSEKCLPPGTVHIRLPRVFNVAKRLDIDYAPAMVGFEFKNGRSVPVYDGIVVCTEFKDAILEAYDEEEDRRRAEETRRNEAMAVSRWYQLLSSMITRERLNKLYGDNSSEQIRSNSRTANGRAEKVVGGERDAGQNGIQSPPDKEKKMTDKVYGSPTEEHEHVFLDEDACFDEQTSVTTKRCCCGFSLQVEEM